MTPSRRPKLEQELFKQRKRLAGAERTLQTKTTKSALESKRIAGEKVDWCLGKLNDLRRTELNDEDHRIFPGWYAPVLIERAGRRIIVPMRYQCRLAGKPSFYDTKYPGTYNARRDNLEGFWKDAHGSHHAIMVANAFFENVSKHRTEGRALREGEKEENVILEFRPKPTQDICSHAYGRTGRKAKTRCCRLRRSRMSPRPRLRRRDTIGA